MPTPRFLTRHVQQTIVEHVRTELTALSWFEAAAADRPFGTDAVTLDEVDPEAATDVPPNTVAITVPEQGPDGENEMGGGTYRRELTVFIDVLGEKPSISLSIAEDIIDSLRDRVIPVKDFAQSPAVDSSAYIEMGEITMERPPSSYGATDFKRNWRALVADLVVYFEVA